MDIRLRFWLTFSSLAVLPAAWASAQSAGQTAVPQQAPQSAVPAPATVAPPAPMVLPPLLWHPRDAQDLLAFIQQIGNEGLDPADYDPAGLTAALRSGNPMLVSQAASERFNLVSNDLALGHVSRKDRDGWHIADKDLDRERQYALMKTALEQHRVTEALGTLLPTHPQYRDLKNALLTTAPGDAAKANRIRLNMDRWRWLPRDLGQKYIIVNVPAFYVSLVEDGVTRWRQRAVAGAIKTPTPMLSVMATGVSINPWWEVPKSIEPEVRGKRGYVALRGKDGKIQRWRQPPGPNNALGELKFVMYNPHNIYLHDTNARSRFNSQIRSLSHGCIRTQNVVDLAKTIFTEEANPQWTAEKIDSVLASKKTVQANFAQPIPVYIVYFSAAASTDGRIINYGDVYRRDPKVLAALLDQRSAGSGKAATR
ncbi:MAG: L,D-transpeptidase family protein [Sphingomonas sp.]|nr:L,D-transpeptidase family protein [Sphingomonas sp.]